MSRALNAEHFDRQELLETLLNRSVDGVIAIDLDGRLVYWNPAMEQIMGIRREKALGRNVFEALPFLERVGDAALLREAAEGRSSSVIDRRYELPATGRSGHYEAGYSPYRSRDGRVVGAVGIFRDVTERSRAEQLLRETENRFRTMADCAPVLLWMAGPDAMCDFFNESWLAFTGRTMDEERGVGWAEGLHPEDLERVVEHFMENFSARRAFRMEYRLMRHDGQYRWILDTGVPRHLPDGTFAGFIGSCIDITERREAEDQIGESLREKEALLREIHHRVKNNLQVVSSLLRLQSASITDPDALQVFGQSQDRIRSMALIHESLYQSEGLEQIDFGRYVERLAAQLLMTYQSQHAPIRLDLDLAPIRLDLDRAIPCGLILNELVTNSFKHAFADREGGRVSISLGREPDGGIALAVSDDGVGLPAGLVGAGSLGLKLIGSLVEQIGGTLETNGEDGTAFRLRFEA